MSADSPRRGVHKGAQVVSPQPIVDRSIIDSVAGIINDIVPQAYAGVPNSENKESITWARFEYADVNDPALYPDYNEGSSTPPLLLVLGYTTGVQVWLIAATGEATEVLSWWQGIVRTLRILPNPKTDDEQVDPFEAKRPMVAICDSAGPGPQFCNISFISLKTGEQTKSIKFKNPVCDILANKRSVVVAFSEKIAVFDSKTLEDILTVTTCYASPGPNPNPIALGTRWLAYSEKKLLPARRSSGGCEGEGVQSYTATVLYAAKSLGKGLRGLGETVASSLTGNSVSPMTINNMGNDITQPGVVTILDLQAAKEEKELDDANMETIIAHFTAHSDAIVAMNFDLTGALLMTADKRGHDFHVFRIQPHPGGSTLAAVHHLYVLHRGDTTAKVQDMTFSSDTRWAAVSTVRGTTHVFPVAPYGGPVGVRTHSTPHVVNRLSRFHRSAGLTDDGTRSHSPVSHAELPLLVYPYSNPRLPPYPHPTILHPLAQIRQPSSLSHANNQSQPSRPQQRQRLHSDDSGALPLKICACFAPPRAWIYAQRESSCKVTKRAVDSLFIMACHGNLIQYDLEPKPAAGVPKEKVCDDTMIELEVEAKGQWPLLRSPNSVEIMPPLPASSPLLTATTVPKNAQQADSTEDRWLSQVEIVTHAGPHRRLWMGPQFVFKTYNAPSGVAVNLVEAEAVEIGVTGGSRPARSNPVNMPHATSRPLVPVVIDGSGSSYEQSPRFVEAYGDPLDGENVRVGSGENQLREDLAEAMLETSIAPNRAPGRRSVFERVGQPVAKVVNPLGTVITVPADDDDVSSSQEFDSVEETLFPDPPKNVCAEEGPASLGDLEPESQILRDLTEICAEMRSASEPAIDHVPDESIREIRERKSLCVEIAVAVKSSSIDFEREEAFRDVPTSLSLCAEQGEIPSSPMTQAKETVWCKRSGKHKDIAAQEKNFAKAKYVVNYDEDSVVLLENSQRCEEQLQKRATSKGSKTEQSSEQARKPSEQERPTASKSNKGSCESTGKKPCEGKVRVEKYIVKEHEDSIVIEDTRYKDTKETGTKKKENTKKIDKTKGTEKVEVRGSLKEKEKEKAKSESVDSFVELTRYTTLDDDAEKDISVEGTEILKTSETSKSEVSSKPLLPVDLPPPDDFSSIEYHMIEDNCPSKPKDKDKNKEAACLNQSDEDIEHIEHIQSPDLTQIREVEGSEDPGKCRDCSCSESSPVAQRKSSKSTISDDDLEYIHSSELVDAIEKYPTKSTNASKNVSEDVEPLEGRRHSRHTLSSDDDLEHVQHSDVCEQEPTSAKTDIPEQPSESTVTVKKSAESSDQTIKTKSKKRKDIVVIDNDSTEAEVTVIVKGLDREDWVRNKTPEKDAEEPEKSSPGRKTKSKSKVTTGATKRPQSSFSSIEIIDIDAMQKAEMETATEPTSSPECKILSPQHENSGTRSRRSRKNKKSSSSDQETSSTESALHSSKVKIAELQEAAEELLVDSTWQETEAPSAEVSWSSIVKKKSAVATLEEQIVRKEIDLEPLIEVEERSEGEDTRRPSQSDVRDSQSQSTRLEPSDNADAGDCEKPWHESEKSSMPMNVQVDTSAECDDEKSGGIKRLLWMQKERKNTTKMSAMKKRAKFLVSNASKEWEDEVQPEDFQGCVRCNYWRYGGEKHCVHCGRNLRMAEDQHRDEGEDEARKPTPFARMVQAIVDSTNPSDDSKLENPQQASFRCGKCGKRLAHSNWCAQCGQTDAVEGDKNKSERPKNLEKCANCGVPLNSANCGECRHCGHWNTGQKKDSGKLLKKILKSMKSSRTVTAARTCPISKKPDEAEKETSSSKSALSSESLDRTSDLREAHCARSEDDDEEEAMECDDESANPCDTEEPSGPAECDDAKLDSGQEAKRSEEDSNDEKKAPAGGEEEQEEEENETKNQEEDSDVAKACSADPEQGTNKAESDEVEHDVVPERSSSSDELCANVDTEETLTIEVLGSRSVSNTIIAGGKRSSRCRRKRRR